MTDELTNEQKKAVEKMAREDDPYNTGAGDAHYRDIVRKGGGELPPIVKWTALGIVLLFATWILTAVVK